MIKTKILIADTHTLTREGLKSLLLKRGDIIVAGEAIDSKELFSQINKSTPDIVIIDYNISGYFSMNDLLRINKEYSSIRVLVISANQKKEDLLSCLNYGINGYLLKECDEEEILRAVYAAANGEKFFCGRVMDTILEKIINTSTSKNERDVCCAVKLSEREIEIIKLIAKGYTTKRIAEKLILSFHTIGTHRKNIFKKLNIRSSSELVLYAIHKGIIPNTNP